MREQVIICVDDEETVLRSLKRELNDSLGDNYLIETAEDGREALEVIEELLDEQYDIPLIISDHIMPGMRGDELLKHIHKLTPKTLKIMLTGQADMSAVTNAVNFANLYRYIAKPWEKADLSLTVREALRSYLQDKQLEEQNIILQNMNRELEQINKAYERFVPCEFLGFLNRNSIIDVQLGDQTQQDITILFSDIRSFTALSERMTPQENFDFLNAYLGRIGPIIRKHRGFIDKYIGDAVMAIFPNRPDDALQAAIEMLHEIAEYNVQFRAHNAPPIKVGIGIHIGSVMLGIIGEEQRLEGTAISDAVNLASRLEGITKVYGASIIISEDMLTKIEDPEHYHSRFLGQVQVKGKANTVPVFEIYNGDPEPVRRLKYQTGELFEQGLRYYLTRDYEKAAKAFQQILATNPQDATTQCFLKRAKQFLAPGISSAWNGIEMIDST